MARRPRGYWDDDKNTERALRSLDDGSGLWPTRRRFAAAGLDGLHASLRVKGTSSHWAGALGLEAPLRAGEPRRWTADAIEAALSFEIERLGHWPSTAELEAEGLGGLVGAVRKQGGVESWRHRHAASRAPAWRIWTTARIAHELQAAVTDLGRWPTNRELTNRGLSGLLQRLQRDGSADMWAERMGVRRTVVRRWDERQVAAELEPLIVRLGHWPSQGEFASAGLSGLAASIKRRGTAQYWAGRFGVVTRRGRLVEPPAPHLTTCAERERVDHRALTLNVEATLDAWVDSLGHWPSYREFERAGRHALHHRLRAGGRSFWRGRLVSDGLDGAVIVRGPLATDFETGLAAAWRYVTQTGHLNVPPDYRDARTGLPLERWLVLLGGRVSASAVRARALLEVVRSCCTDPDGKELAHLVATSTGQPHRSPSTTRLRGSSGNH